MAKNNKISKISDSSFLASFSDKFDVDSFIPDLSKIAKKAGKEVVAKSLLLYYILISANIPFSVRLSIAGALSYVILPFDLVPDFIVGLGFADDIAALCYIVDQVQCYRTPEIDIKVENKLKEIFD